MDDAGVYVCRTARSQEGVSVRGRRTPETLRRIEFNSAEEQLMSNASRRRVESETLNSTEEQLISSSREGVDGGSSLKAWTREERQKPS